jgi:CRISPR-associated protein Cas1
MRHIVDISDTPARLRVEHGCLCIEASGKSLASIPVKQIAALILSHPQISCTQAVLSSLAENGGILIACDAKRLPVSMHLPLQANSVQTERLRAQMQSKVPLRKRLWQEIVRAKIKQQAFVLNKLHGSDGGLSNLANSVRSGDTTNVEAQAARRYWGRLFPNQHFRRDTELGDQNVLLNYGYAILRSITARAICGTGLHPSIGIHHRNRYNAFCLADDLMEPFRPVVDIVVAAIVNKDGVNDLLGSHYRKQVLAALYQRWFVNGEKRSIFEATEMLASSMVDIFLGTRKELKLPSQLELSDVVQSG